MSYLIKISMIFIVIMMLPLGLAGSGNGGGDGSGGPGPGGPPDNPPGPGPGGPPESGDDDDIIDVEESDNKEDCYMGLSSPVMGLGWNGSVAGDKLPTLYTWRDTLCIQHTTDYHPVEWEYIGGVLITPPQTAGEPIQSYSYKDSARYKRLMTWKANHAE